MNIYEKWFQIGFKLSKSDLYRLRIGLSDINVVSEGLWMVYNDFEVGLSHIKSVLLIMNYEYYEKVVSNRF